MKRFHAPSFVSAAAPAAGLDLAPLECLKVAQQLDRIHAFASLLEHIELRAEDELAPKFEP